MAELQATIEISVELNKFYNVDLFQRGYYQIQTVLKTPPKSAARVEITDNKLNSQQGQGGEATAAFKQSNTGVSQRFQILYRNEEVDISDIFIYRIHTLVESAKLESNLDNLDLRLEVQLWCTDDDESSDSDPKMELANTRILQLHISPTKGLHHALPVLFDYFHLSAVEVVIHGTIIAIHQPYLTMPKSQKSQKSSDQSSLEVVYFGQKTTMPPPSNSVTSSTRMQQAHLMHKTICNILLSAHESLQEYLQLFASKIPGNNFQFVRKDCHTRLGEAVMKVQGVLEEDDLIQTAITDITQLCAENVILWAQFLEIVLKQPRVHRHLSQDHHNLRIRRFAEAFFTLENNKASCLSCYDPGIHGHSALASIVKNSSYFSNLPRLPVQCLDLDGDETSLPIIFEDIYHDARAPPPQVYQTPLDNPTSGSPRTRSSSNSSSSLTSEQGGAAASGTNSTSSPSGTRKRPSGRGKKKFIKNIKREGFKRPSSYYCSEVEATQAGQPIEPPPTGATLIGYRKNQEPQFVPSEIVNLGTLSPDTESPYSQLSTQPNKSLSPRSSILPTACMNRGSNDSLPSLYETPGPITPDFTTAANGNYKPVIPPTSPPVISTPQRPQCSSADIIPQSSVVVSPGPSIAMMASLPPAGSKPPPVPTSPPPSLSSSMNSLHSKEVNCGEGSGASEKVVVEKHSNGSTNLGDKGAGDFASRSTLNENDYETLACDISSALGEKEPSASNILTAIASSNNEDFSDDDNNVANGFDDVLETYRKDLCDNQNIASKEKTSGAPSSNNAAAASCKPSESSGLGSLVSITPTASCSEQPFASNSTLDMRNDSALGSDVSSQEEASSSSSPNKAPSSSSEGSVTAAPTPSASLPTISTTFPESETSATTPLKASSSVSASSSSTPTKASYNDPRHRVTVIELLKEEYRRSLPLDSSDSSTVDSSTVNLSAYKDGFSGHRASSDSDILKNCDEEESQSDGRSLVAKRCGLDNGEKKRGVLSSSSSYPELSHIVKGEHPRLVSVVGHTTVNFVQLRESLKLQMDFPGYLYSECPTLASTIPYFQVPREIDDSGSGVHLIVCVHGLDGNSADLRLVRTYIEMALPGFKLEFLMSDRNQQDTFADFDKMTDRLVDEIINYLDNFGFNVSRISFVGHSLGNVIIRSTLSRPKMAHLLPKLYTLLSLSGPHLGTIYNTSGLVNMGMWFMQKWKKSGSLLQLALKDHPDPRQTFLYKLSLKPVLQHFKHVLLVGSHQDRYVPYHSSRIEICRSAQKDSSVMGAVYREMVQNILEPVIQSPLCTLIRYDVFHSLPSTANTMIGRAAHIAVLDSEIFIEKFLTVTGLKYFQ
ncbi:hypothetical protein EGW08_007645 [Elysia chlorotica]|uniref:DUF676 domain-containing protein n=1 Tax=Elysia chlorotica TaxID=188477 RepID=A0A3S1BIS1_ELYCH|nr:hypothetical protein EGW08_007645 [Elysia chlorotica]